MLILGRKYAIIFFSSCVQSYAYHFLSLKALYPVLYIKCSARKIKALV